MKQVTETVTVKSDLTGQLATATRDFSLGGVNYTLDLTDKEAGVFDRTFEKYISKAQIVKAKGTTRNGEAAVLREWASANGFPVGKRGRIASEVREAWIASQSAPAAEAPADSE